MDETFLAEIRRFVTDHVLGHERQFDDPEAAAPNAAVQAFSRLRLTNWFVSTAHGGRGLSLEDSVDIVDELAYGDAGTAFTLFISIACTSVLELYGTPEQQARFLGGMVEHCGFAAMMGSEKDAGSELINIKTTALRRADGRYVVNGDKYFSTNAAFAEFMIVVAACPDDPRGYKCFLIAKDTPGVQLTRRWSVMGVRGSAQYEVALRDVVLTEDLALPPNGLRALEIGLNSSRILIAASAIGICRRIRDICLEHARGRRLKDQSLLRNHVFGAKIGQFEADITCMRALCKAAAREMDELFRAPDAAAAFLKTGTIKPAIVAKLVCGQIGWKVASTATEMFGGVGYTSDVLIDKLLRDVRYVSIIEGGEDVCRELLYSRFVKQPA